MKKEYRVTILVDPTKVLAESILDEQEDISEHIKVAIQMSIDDDFLTKNMEIEITDVRYDDYGPEIGIVDEDAGSDVGWDIED
jgi:hypothetical protein